MNSVLTFLNGKKTYIAAVLTCLIGLNAVFKVVGPEVEAALVTLAATFGIVGIGHKIDKNTASLLPPAPESGEVK